MRSRPGCAPRTAARACSASATASCTAARASPARPSSRRRFSRSCATLIPLAPLHQPHNLAAIEAVSERLPGVPQVACFDTSFHRGQPAVAELFRCRARSRRAGVQRYGFHGLSYEYIASVLPQVAPEIAQRPRHRRAPRQRREPLRAEERQERRQHARLHRARWTLHGHAARRARSRRRPLPVSEPRTLGEGSRDDPLQEVRPARHLRHQQRHARPARQQRAGGAARGGLLRLPRRQGNRRARRGSGRDRRAGVHRRHRRELRRDPQPDLRGLARGSASSSIGDANARKRPADLHDRKPGVGLGDPDQRRTDDRPAHRRRCWD